MSDNNGFNFSPSFQPGADQHGRSQQSYFDLSGGTGASHNHQAYSLMSGTPPTPQYRSAQSAPQRSSEVYSSSTHADVLPGSNGGYNYARAGLQSHGTSATMKPDAISTPSSMDTTALRNRAYGTSLGHDSRNHDSPSRGASSMQQVFDGNRSQPSTRYAGPSAYGMTGPLATDYGHHRPDSRGGATTRREAKSTGLPNSNLSPYRYASDGNVQAKPSALSQGDLDPLLIRPPNLHVPTAQMIERPHSASRLSKQTSQSGNRSRLDSQPPAFDIKGNGGSPEQQTQVENQYPTIVHPHAIFDDARHQNNRAAEAARKAAENSTPKQAEAETSGNGAADDSTRKNQMALEMKQMKQMIEKMKGYRDQDPALFSEIWGQLTTGKSPNQGSAKDASSVESNSKAATIVNENDHSPTPNPINNYLPSDSALAVGSLEQDGGDLEKSPAQRQRRKSSTDAGKKFIDRVQTVDSRNATPRSTSAAHHTPTRPGNTAPRIESPIPALQGQSRRVTTAPSNEIPKPKRQSNRQVAVRPEVIYVEDTVPEPTEASPPTNGTTGSTTWPQGEKKWALANAAADLLTSSSMNAGKSITPTEIVHILNQNPSYPELCEILQSRDFVIDRGHFAVALLQALPSLAKNKPKSKRSSTGKIYNSDDPPQSGAANGEGNRELNGEVNGEKSVKGVVNGTVNGRGNGAAPKPSAKIESSSQSYGKDGVVSGYKNGGLGVLNLRRKSQNPSTKEIRSGGQFGKLVSDEGSPSTGAADRTLAASTTESESRHFSNQTQEPAAPALTKKEMANKKSFGEIVDLTQELSDEQERQPNARLHGVHNSNDEAATSSPVIASSAASKRAKATSIHPTPNKGTMSASGAVSKGTSSSSVPQNANKARRKSRMSLLGRADGPGLNSSVATEDESSDLSRFKYAESQQDLLQSSIIVRPMDKKNDALRRSTYNPNTIARDVLVSAAKHPTLAPLNHHLEILRKNFAHVDSSSDLNTFRWDLVDPGGSAVANTERQDIDMIDLDAEDLSMDMGAPAVRQTHVSIVEGERVGTAGIIHTEPIKETPSRRNSKVPRGSEMSVRGGLGKSFDSSIGFVQRPDKIKSPLATPRGSGKATRARPQDAAPGEPREASQPTSRPQASPSESRSRQRGRSLKKSPQSASPGSSDAKTPSRLRPSDAVPSKPSGLRNVMPSDGVAVVIESRSPGIVNEKKRKSASKESWPRKKERPSIHPSEPSYKVYKCLWKKCPYELHNLENLRKHVHKHREEFHAKPLLCLWADCPRAVWTDEVEVLKPHEFKSEATWESHIDKKHVDRYAWEFGDGPSANTSGAEASDFLSDSQGRRVTPRVTADSAAPPDQLPLSSSRRTARLYHKAHGNGEAETAKSVLKSVVAEKRATGLGITKGGSPLVKEKLRGWVRDGEQGFRKTRREDL